MSDAIKAIIGENLYKQVTEKLGEKKFDLLDTYIPKSRFNELNGKLKANEEKITTYEKQLTDTKELLKGSEDLQNKYNDLDKKYKEDLSLKDHEIINTKKKLIAENELIKAGVKHTKLLLGQVDWDKLSVENDNLLGFKDMVDGFKKDFEDLFPVTNKDGNPSGEGRQGGAGSNDDDDIIQALKDLKV